jgi:hypothetical protein
MRARCVIAVLVTLAALVVPTVALAVVPSNDDYLKSTTINRADTRLTREEVKTSVDFFADRDDDNVFDPLDDCPGQPGVRAHGGCPPELTATPKLTATPTGAGVIVNSLSVAATKGAKIEVRCRRRCSGHQARTAGVASFPLLRGRAVSAGAAIEIFVTKADAIGRYTRYDIVRGNFRRTDRCLPPSSRKPRRKCT